MQRAGKTQPGPSTSHGTALLLISRHKHTHTGNAADINQSGRNQAAYCKTTCKCHRYCLAYLRSLCRHLTFLEPPDAGREGVEDVCVCESVQQRDSLIYAKHVSLKRQLKNNSFTSLDRAPISAPTSCHRNLNKATGAHTHTSRNNTVPFMFPAIEGLDDKETWVVNMVDSEKIINLYM